MIAILMVQNYLLHIEEMIADTTPELMMVLVITFLIPPLMAFLSLTLKDSINRWLNIILGIVFAGFALVGPIGYLAIQPAYSAYAILIGIVGFVATALIVWYAWKSKQKT
jgi:putative Ca2+/H+ antiporter (TMEM165/GDT1 family)